MEIERKFLIKRPSNRVLDNAIKATDGTRREILQTYLTSQNPEIERRVRRVIEGKRTIYYYTEKSDVGVGVRQEREIDIPRHDYLKKLESADFRLHPIRKTRYCIPHNDKLLEIDIYPFLKDLAILEVELKDINDNI